MKIVLDTNVLVAALVAHGSCSELLEHCVLRHELVLSEPILVELKEVLVRKFGFTQAESSDVYSLLWSRATIVVPARLSRPVCRDPDDDMVLATAQAAGCSAILTGDKDLTTLRTFQGIPICAPADFWALEQELADGR